MIFVSGWRIDFGFVIVFVILIPGFAFLNFAFELSFVVWGSFV